MGGPVESKPGGSGARVEPTQAAPDPSPTPEQFEQVKAQVVAAVKSDTWDTHGADVIAKLNNNDLDGAVQSLSAEEQMLRIQAYELSNSNKSALVAFDFDRASTVSSRLSQAERLKHEAESITAIQKSDLDQAKNEIERANRDPAERSSAAGELSIPPDVSLHPQTVVNAYRDRSQ